MRLRPLLILLAAIAAAACDRKEEPWLLATAVNPQHTTSTAEATGDAARGRGLFVSYGCTTCHSIPGVRGADGVSAPPLARMAKRSHVAGVVKNTPQNLVRWIQDPPAVDPMTAMPNLRVTEQDAHDMAAYLYTLQ